MPVDLERKPLLYDYYANTLNPIYDKRNFDEIDRFGPSRLIGKRNFDEIDRNGLSGLHKRSVEEFDRNTVIGDAVHKRNFDEIDRNGLSSLFKRNFDEIDRTGLSAFFDKKRNRFFKRNSGMDTMYMKDTPVPHNDRSDLGFLMKRYLGAADREFEKRNFDEIDRSGLSGFHFKRNFDEIDRFGPGNFLKQFDDRTGERQHFGQNRLKKNFDEIDRFGFNQLKRDARDLKSDKKKPDESVVPTTMAATSKSNLKE